MNLDIGLRTLGLLAFVAASMLVIVQPDLVFGAPVSHLPTLNPVLLVGRA